MGGRSRSEPRQPDPIKTAEAQTKTNLDTMKANARFNQINQVTPFGSTRWTGTIGSPDRTQTTSLNPQLQGLFFGNDGLVPQISEVTKDPLSFDSARNVSNPGFQGFRSARNADAGNIDAKYQGDAGYRNYNLANPEDYGNEISRVEKAVFDRASGLLGDQYDKRRNAMERDLWQKGIATGSQADTDVRNQYSSDRSRDYNDLALASVLAGSQEHQRLADLSARNRGQLFGEEMALSQDELSRFAAQEGANQAAFGRDLATSAENRSGNNEAFARDLAQRQQGVAEQMAIRNQPIQDLVSLLAGVAPGGVPNMPQFTQFTSSAPDIMGMTGSNYAARANAAANRHASNMGLLGGLFGAIF